MELRKAIDGNRHYAARRLWTESFAQIVSVLGLHPDCTEREFAIAVETYQRSKPPLGPDGILGRRTWKKLEPETLFSTKPVKHPAWLYESRLYEPPAPEPGDVCSIETMTLDELRDALAYKETWIGLSPLRVKRYVIKAGGWRKVFTAEQRRNQEWKSPIPKWAHFARQMFNEEPRTLVRVSQHEADREIDRALGSRALGSDKTNWVAAKLAYSDDVYRELKSDGKGKGRWRTWIEQSQAGTMYHYKTGQDLSFWGGAPHIVFSAVTPHNFTSVFKLCAPDGTGGSDEACFKNKALMFRGDRANRQGFVGTAPLAVGFVRGALGDKSMGGVGENVSVRHIAITDDRYRGSYNYADTMAIGYDLHEAFDVEPDIEWGSSYKDEKQFSSLSSRVFAPKHFDK